MTKQEIYQPVIELLIKRREEEGLTPKELAEDAGITEEELRQFEAGTGCLTLETASDIAKALGICIEPNVLLLPNPHYFRPYHLPGGVTMGDTFGKWTVLGPARIDNFSHTHALCECECHRISYVDASKLRRGKTTSCGKCDRGEKIRQTLQEKKASQIGEPELPNNDLRGMTFGYLLVLDDFPEKRDDGHWWYKVYCSAPGCTRDDKWMRDDKIVKAKTCGCHFGQEKTVPPFVGKQLGFVKVLDEFREHNNRPELKTRCVVCGEEKWVRVENLRKHIGISCRCAPSLRGRIIGKYKVIPYEQERTNAKGFPQMLCEKENGNEIWVSTEQLLRTLAKQLKHKSYNEK